MKDWNTFTLDQHIAYLEHKFKFDSSGTAKSIHELLKAYREIEPCATKEHASTLTQAILANQFYKEAQKGKLSENKQATDITNAIATIEKYIPTKQPKEANTEHQ